MSTAEPGKAVLRSKKTPKKGVTKKTAAKKSLTISAKKVAKKAVVKAVDLQADKTIAANTETTLSKKIQNHLAVPAGRGLMVLSPLRFPLDVDKIAVQTAHFAGAFFVAIGAILTLWHSSVAFYAAPPLSFMAQVFSSQDTSAPVESIQTVQPQEQTQSGVYVNGSTVFVFEPAQPLHGDSVHVNVALPGETEMAYLYARDTKTGATVDFGTFTTFTGATAEMVIDVTEVPDGTYRFYAVATYREQKGSYTVTISDSNLQEVYLVEQVEEENETNEVLSETIESELSIEKAEELDITEPLNVVAEEAELMAVQNVVTDPVINVALNATTLTGNHNLVITVDGATYLEAYALQQNTGIQRFIGLPKEVSLGTWNLLINTTDLPNGTYRFVVNARTPYGFFTERSESVAVYNEIETVADATVLEYQESVLKLMEQGTVDISVFNSSPQTALTPEEQINQLVASGTDSVAATTTKTELQMAFEALTVEHQSEIEKTMQVLAVAYRAGNTHEINKAVEKVSALVDSFMIESPDLLEFSKQEFEKLSLRITGDVETTNKIIAERTGVTAETDSDRDGITDFDEIVIYKTNPKIADSDGDGFTDGAEVLSGYNPIDSTPETPVVYELPVADGIVRDDLLSVDTITTEVVGGTETSAPVAILTGKGLPNSFVTLYIFSTPVVVTVRTDSTGAWMHRFDKELEDGEHQVYAGITNNAGEIVAKSNPLAFVKVAEAYELVSNPVPDVVTTNAPETEETYSVLSLILVTASISVVAIGLVLIMLGAHLEGRGRREILKATETA